VKEANQRATDADSDFILAVQRIGNVVIDGVPAGGENDYLVLREVGEVPAFPFEPRDHLEIGELLDAIDMARGAKVSGARFHYLKGVGARLELAIMTMGLDRALAAGFTPLITPTLVRPEIMQGTGFLGAHSEEIYYLPDDELYLTGTSEVALAGYHADEILDLSDGRCATRAGRRATAARRAATARDTRGIIRVHQFNKLEMFSYVDPADAEAEHERLLGVAGGHAAVARPRLPRHRHGGRRPRFERGRKYDVEAWVPTQEAYRELTSTSNCTTFQARRLDIRHRTESGKTAPGRDAQRHARHDQVARRDPRDPPAGRRLGGGARSAPGLPRRPRTARARRAMSERMPQSMPAAEPVASPTPGSSRSTSTARSCTRTSRSTKRVADAILAARERGHEVTLATGRSWATTAPVLERLELRPEYVVCANGAITMRRDDAAADGYTRAHVETFDPTAGARAIRTFLPSGRLHGRDARRVPASTPRA
jgi:hypothetical protein